MAALILVRTQHKETNLSDADEHMCVDRYQHDSNQTQRLATVPLRTSFKLGELAHVWSEG